MNKTIISFALLAFGGAGAIAAGCSAPDPGVEYLGPRHLDGVVGGSGTSSSTGANPGTGTSSGGGSTIEDAGTVTTTGGGDGGTTGTTSAEGGTTGDGGAAGPLFLGETTPWATALPATTAYVYHQGAGQPQQTPGLDCMQTCHIAGGAGGAFVMAGWVATTAGGTTGAADVEVRAYASGTAAGASAHTDANGFFWLLPPATGAPTGSFNGGARNGTTTQLMPNAQTNYDCNNSGCHGGTAGPIHLP